MESSEDDAGAAAKDSRRASAREKDIGPSELDAVGNASRDASGTRTPGESGAVSEDNFDGDSVPSPSAQDTNASTEAILDMIDEIVDGPGAPRRIPLPSEYDAEPAPRVPEPVAPAPSEPLPPLEAASTSQAEPKHFPLPEQDANTSQSPEEVSVAPVLVPTPSANCESAPQKSSLDTLSVSISESVVAADVANSSISEPSQASSSVPDVNIGLAEVKPNSPLPQALQLEAASTCPLPNIPSSSVEETIPSNCEISDCESNDRTMKHVTSSDNRDNVTVESAESTSSDANVSDGRPAVQESTTRSPLRRRLIRPTLYDRRPDTTVSSTVDSRACDSELTGQTSSDSVTKDVSSSSDVIPPVHGNVKEEANSNVSEISVCKAETSTSPTKKIKLIRQKITPSTSQSEKSQNVIVMPDSEIPSTSSPSLPITGTDSSSECISTTQVREDQNIKPSQGCQSDKPMCDPIIDPLEKQNLSKTCEQANLPSVEPVPQLPNASENVDIQKKIPPMKLNLSVSNAVEPDINETNMVESFEQSEPAVCPVPDNEVQESKQIPKLTIKLGSKQPEEMKSPIPKLTIKPIKPPSGEEGKLDKTDSEPIPNITKLNIKPIPRPPEKINDIHRKSSSSEISESEYSENDETSASDQASTSDQGATETVPKVTIKLGRPGTESEGMFYTEKNVPKLTITGLQNDEQEKLESVSNLKVIVSQSEEKQDKIPKLTIKSMTKSESQLSPKLAMKPTKSVENVGKEGMIDECDSEVTKSKLSQDSLEPSEETKETTHVPKITIKPVLKTDLPEPSLKTLKKPGMCENPENIPVVTKLNIKPILKPADGGETSGEGEEKVPVVSKLNIKPILRPKDSEIDPSIEDIPKVTKLNIKPIKNPEVKTSEQKDCDEWHADSDENSIPVVTKLNIKPILKPTEEENVKESENQSSETGNSSDENADIPVVTKLNIKPIMKPTDLEEDTKPIASSESSIPIVTKLNIKPIVKPEENALPSSPKKEIPVITKLNIKPVVKPEQPEQSKARDDFDDTVTRNPPLVMKINMKAVAETAARSENIKTETKLNDIDEKMEHVYNSINDNLPVVSKLNIKPITKPLDTGSSASDHAKNDMSDSSNTKETSLKQTDNCVSESVNIEVLEKVNILDKIGEIKSASNVSVENPKISQENCLLEESRSFNSHHGNDLDYRKLNKEDAVLASNKNEHETTNKNKEIVTTPPPVKQTALSNCTLLKKLLENKVKDVDTRVKEPELKESSVSYHEKSIALTSSTSSSNCDEIDKVNSKVGVDSQKIKSSIEINETIPSAALNIPILNRVENESATKPLEINITERSAPLSSGQDSPRIILKINKTDHGPSAKIITEELKKPETGHGSKPPENTQDTFIDHNDAQKKGILNSRKKLTANLSPTVALGKRLRSSRVVQEPEKSPARRNPGKRPPSIDTSPPQNKGSELSVLETKRLKLGQLLSNKALTVTPVVTKIQNASSPMKVELDSKQTVKTVNHSLLNNENCSKNGNSKLHNILSNLQAKQMQALPLNAINCMEKSQSILPEIDSSTSTGSSDVVEITPIDNTHPQVQEMIINENSESHDFNMVADDLSQDPLEVDHLKTEASSDSVSVPFTPQPKKRGRPRKIPLSEGAKPVMALPTPALEERPQRSLRLTRDRPAILVKPRGRGRGRGYKRAVSSSPKEPEPAVETANKFFVKEKTPEEIDPTSSRVKLPRMTEALDKMPSSCTTPLSSRKREASTSTDMKMFPETQELKVVLENTLPKLEETFMKSPETPGGERGRGRGRGSRGGRGRAGGRTPRARGRGRGGGRGAMYMKETMGIYGRVCGPATTTVHLFEEETCMMDDNATPAKPSHLLDEDSQSSVKSSTNESSKMRKSKFADLFDSNKVWTAADVKEYMWPPPENPSDEHQVMMIQEQVAMFLGVKSFKRRYPELKRRAVGGEEREYILRKGLVTEALCDLGITAVDASEVLDIMLSDYPHKYEEYRGHQRARHAAAPEPPPPPRADRVEMKPERVEAKPEPPKVDPEKARQDMAAAAMASASEWNTRLGARRRGACADLQSMTVQRRRAPPRRAPTHVRPPAGFYPHALLPGQYQHAYRAYTPQQLRYTPGACSRAPPAGFYPHALLPGQYQHAYRAYTPQQLRYTPGACSRAPPAGFYPHALLPGQYQHAYRAYTPQQLRYTPGACSRAPPAGFYPHALLPGQYQHAYRAYTPQQLRYTPGACSRAPPAGFYPHALLPGQYQHAYRAYTPQQLRYTPGACSRAPPAGFYPHALLPGQYQHAYRAYTPQQLRYTPGACSRAPPAGFYPHALLPGQYQHAYRAYTPQQLRYTPGACSRAPPAGFYPHALLPGQYQHAYRAYTPQQLRYTPGACSRAPPAGFYPHALLPGQYQHAYRAYTPQQLRYTPGACSRAPPAGFYPHALLPGQYQHAYRAYTPQQLRYTPGACSRAPPAGFYPHALLPGQYQHAYRAYTPQQLRYTPGACSRAPPAGFYPHALLPGQYQHAYRAYTPQQLRYTPGACSRAPPAGFYPHALLPGQYQHAYRAYTPQQLRYTPGACSRAPPAGFYPHALLPGQYQHAYRAYTPQQLRYTPGACSRAPPAGFYPHALLPGQYQHAYRAYTPQQLRYTPGACSRAPPAGFYPHALLPGQYQHAYRAYTPQQLRYTPGACSRAPPAGFYPHALLPGQYQHAYRAYTPQQLRYTPGACSRAPPAGFYPHALLPGQYQHAYRAYTPQQLRYTPGACSRAPPAGFYPHALLPGQYQHAYRAYTPQQLRYFPLNTAMAAPPAPASASESSSESEPEWGSHCSSSDTERHPPAKRKKLTKAKRSSVLEAKEEPRDEELCRACRLREEGNRKYSHERFLVCANCQGRLHPSCVELPADTIRKVREYAWQCAECKTCGACALPADDDKMLFCDLCDRGFHIYCVGLERVPSGRWHCVECAVCKSCGARAPGGLAGGDGDWQHQTRRGPGGHKLYSHSLCAPCARAYRIGRYCPLCARSFIGPKGTMQLVICKLCDRQLHQECVRQTVSALNVLDYTCGECRRSGITSRSAAARLAPRTIATLFMAKRRFNKYAHRQYLASRQRSLDGDATDPGESMEPAEPTEPADPTEPSEP